MIKPSAILKISVVIFIALFLYSTTLYPGGSQNDLHSAGFSWIHNYLCNLMNQKAINGRDNPSRTFAILGLIILCLGMSSFFIQFSKLLVQKTIWRRITAFGGVLSMLFAGLIFTKYHDQMSLLSSIFGCLAVVGILRTLYLKGSNTIKYSGLALLFLLILNNYIYYTEHGIYFLPLLQKCTLAGVLIWILSLNELMISPLEK